jgi:hypothetical protein
MDTIIKERKLDDPKYFVNYYHSHNPYLLCECGQTIRRMYKLKHTRLAKHKFLLARKAEEQQINLETIEDMGS